MNRYVSLSTDQNPVYAIYAPLVTRLWKRLGYKPVLFMHSGSWSSPFEAFVRASLPDDVPIVDTPRLDPLSVGNTMRAIRLCACACAFIESDDLILTSDIDMAPLDRTWFNRGGPAIILRADLHGPIEGASTLMDGDKGRACQPGLFRFPMCYVGLQCAIWRDITPYRPSCEGDPVELGRRLMHGCRYDAHDYDEQFTSARLLLSRWAVGSLQLQPDGSWKQGELYLVPMSDWPGGWPQRMIIGGDAAKPETLPPIDFHMPKAITPSIPNIILQHWPEEREWLLQYWEQACRLAGA